MEDPGRGGDLLAGQCLSSDLGWALTGAVVVPQPSQRLPRSGRARLKSINENQMRERRFFKSFPIKDRTTLRFYLFIFFLMPGLI